MLKTPSKGKWNWCLTCGQFGSQGGKVCLLIDNQDWLWNAKNDWVPGEIISHLSESPGKKKKILQDVQQGT